MIIKKISNPHEAQQNVFPSEQQKEREEINEYQSIFYKKKVLYIFLISKQILHLSNKRF